MKPLRSSLVEVGVHGLSSVQFMCSDTAWKKFFLCPGGQGRKNRETFGATPVLHFFHGRSGAAHE